jgi:hypothetical protein
LTDNAPPIDYAVGMPEVTVTPFLPVPPVPPDDRLPASGSGWLVNQLGVGPMNFTTGELWPPTLAEAVAEMRATLTDFIAERIARQHAS